MINRVLLFLIICASLVGQNTARFPASVAGDQDLLVAKDNSYASLSAPVTAVDQAIPVTLGSVFAGNGVVTIDSEQILICSVVGNTLNVCPGGRGFAGTTAAFHSSNASVRGNVTAWHHNQLAAEIKAVEAALGANLDAVEKPLTFDTPLSRATNAISCATCVVAGGSYSDPSWLTITKSKVGLGNVEDTALSTWAGSGSITTIGTLTSGTVPWARLSGTPATYAPSAHTHSGTDVTTKQINFTIIDSNTAIPASSAWIWTPEYGPAVLTQVRCISDTGDGVIQIQLGGTGDILAGNLTCASGAWASTTSFSAASIPTGYAVGYRIVSGTAKQYTVSIKYTGN